MIPQDIKNDKTKSIYLLYNSDDTIKEKWTRKPHMDDTKAQTNKDGVITLPQFYGEWVQTPRDEINKLNDIILSKKPGARRTALQNPDVTQHATKPAKRLTERELNEQRSITELEKLLDLLNKRYDEMTKGEKDDNTK